MSLKKLRHTAYTFDSPKYEGRTVVCFYVPNISIKLNAEILIQTYKEPGLEINVDKTKYGVRDYGKKLKSEAEL
jgi:hypothetical protein